ncbi:MAG: hypothetical protein GX197_06280 [Firmicutes bacterium]|nr:hypothetical protein [Bacillota bacterium]
MVKHLFKNTNYFFQEAKIIFSTSLLSNLTSLFSMALIFLFLTMVIAGWWVSNHVIEVIQGEAEINVYYPENLTAAEVSALLEEIKKIDGIREARIVQAEEAYARMEEILGKEAEVLQYFTENPFGPFIEVNIYLDVLESVLTGLQKLDKIDYVRDNREVLEDLRDLAGIMHFLSYLVVAGVGVATLIIISHIIRLGIDQNKEHIKTLILLGAPDGFIAVPYLLVGLFLSAGGGIVAALLSVFALKYIYVLAAGPLPFIPLPSLESLTLKLSCLVIILSALLGLIGSVFGLHTAKID